MVPVRAEGNCASFGQLVLLLWRLVLSSVARPLPAFILTFTRCSILRLVLLTYAAAKVACAGHEAENLVRELRGLLEQARQEAESAKRQLADATHSKEVAEAKVRDVLGI